MKENNKSAVKRKKKPDFIVKEAKFCSRIKKRWRCPRGIHSAVRQWHRGRQANPHPGYGAPKVIRGKHPSGLEMVVVHNQKELLSLNPKNQGMLISSTLGKKNKLALLKLAQEKKIRIFNVKDAAEKIKTIQAGLEERKKAKSEKLREKSKKKEEKQKKAEEKQKKEEEKNKKEAEESQPGKTETSKIEEVEEKKKEEQRELEKVITKRQ